ncbi:RNA polymerase sigma factor (sigma-70 family) [Kribbella aluminosa]|uniref:RNA polymerase sigma factor (Sigma-70 family) n=1 Tax=Kribbella aluminosa TaxID=416017 RepID=A0ABS4UQ68_9ACTN|nr:sigma-70 family RNA polymerase sigma factor [Kribbella aluminosa]MBP2353791.1 RNA polymerase sigma factor (sigma-70 family) [Kribbella aluminosa]
MEHLLRGLTPQVLGALVRRYGHFETCEDAVQEALLVAARQWPAQGVPDEPRTWLIRVASRRLIDLLRNEEARRRREDTVRAPDVAPTPVSDVDDSLTVLFLCCHPVLPVASQLPLTLRAVGGLTTTEIAAALLTPEATIGQRISRAKQKLRGQPFRRPDEYDERLAAVLQVLYLIFNEGYTSTAGDELGRVELAREAIRLARMLRELLPDDGEVAGLLALMLLTDARRTARTSADGALVPLDEQDRSQWDHAAIAEGTELITWAMRTTTLGPYQLQAAIAAVHSEATTAADTDWRQILALYNLLEPLLEGPVVRLNRAVATAMVHGPDAGLALLDSLTADPRATRGHRYDAVRAHLLELRGDHPAAADAYLTAAKLTTNTSEQRYLRARAKHLRTHLGGGGAGDEGGG